MARITLTMEDRQRIRQLRAAAGLSRPELAEKMRITEKTIRNIESESSGRATFNDYTIECLARALGATVSEIVAANGKENQGLMPSTGHADGAADEHLIGFYRMSTPLSAKILEKVYSAPIELVITPAAESTAREPVEFHFHDLPFHLPDQIEPYAAPIKERLLVEARHNPRLFDGKVVRLRSLAHIDGTWRGEIQRASYFDALATNFRGLDFRPDGEAQTLRQRLSGRSHRLEEFDKSVLVNHLGFVCLIESADGKLIVPERSGQVANRQHTLSASVTGAVDLRDVAASKGASEISLDAIVSATGSRETERELGIELDEFRFLGLIREFERGGKPELYFFARSSHSASKIKAAAAVHASERYESKTIHALPLDSADLDPADNVSRAALESRIKVLLDQAAQCGNLTLRTGLLLLHRMLLPPT